MSELTTIQSQVLAGLLTGKSVSAVARDNGIHRSTIYQWRHQHPYFTLALDQARSRHKTAIYDFVQDLAEQALETVATLLTSEDANLRLRAAQTILRVAEPGHLSSDTRTAMNLETLEDHSMANRCVQTILPQAPTAPKGQQGSNDLAASPFALEPEPTRFDTIRQNPTVEWQPSRNSRCACGSGLKYKRCCGSASSAMAA
jgi:transposase-like protein